MTRIPLDQIDSIPVNQALQNIISSQKSQKGKKEEGMGRNICVKHGKDKEIICLTDMMSVCSDCVLFGIHTEHKYI